MEWRPYTTRCKCSCHHYSGVSHDPDVDVRDALHAVLACETCRNLHSPALSDEPPPDRLPEQRPAPFCWEPPDDGN